MVNFSNKICAKEAKVLHVSICEGGAKILGLLTMMLHVKLQLL